MEGLVCSFMQNLTILYLLERVAQVVAVEEWYEMTGRYRQPCSIIVACMVGELA